MATEELEGTLLDVVSEMNLKGKRINETCFSSVCSSERDSKGSACYCDCCDCDCSPPGEGCISREELAY